MQHIINFLTGLFIIGGTANTQTTPMKSPVAFWAALTLKSGLPYKLVNHQFQAIQVLNAVSSKILLTIYKQKNEGSVKVYFNLMGASKAGYNKTCPKYQVIQKALKACKITPYDGIQNDGKGYFVQLPIVRAPDVKATLTVESAHALNQWALKTGATSRQNAVKGTIIRPMAPMPIDRPTK